MSEALKKSEEFHMEKTMLDDKLKATDWEATNEEIMELVARESYLQWLKDNEKRNTSRHSLNLNQTLPTYATCSTWDQTSSSSSSSSTNNQVDLANPGIRRSPPRQYNRNTHTHMQRTNNRRSSTITPPHSPSQSKLSQLKSSPQAKSDTKKLINSREEPLVSNQDTNSTRILYDENMPYMSIMNELSPDLFGLNNNDWLGLDAQADAAGNDGDILARVLAASQQEYLESLKAKRQTQQH